MRGPGTNEEQIKSLHEKLTDGDIKTAEKIARNTHPDVVALAYKMTIVNITKNKLPKAVTKLLDGLSKEDAEVVRGKLVQAQHDPIKVIVRDGGPHYMS